MTVPDRRTDIVTPWAPDRAKKRIWSHFYYFRRGWAGSVAPAEVPAEDSLCVGGDPRELLVAELVLNVWSDGDLGTNQGSVFRSRDKYWPITGQYSGHLTSIDQSQVSIQVTWPVLTNQSSVLLTPMLAQILVTSSGLTTPPITSPNATIRAWSVQIIKPKSNSKSRTANPVKCLLSLV